MAVILAIQTTLLGGCSSGPDDPMSTAIDQLAAGGVGVYNSYDAASPVRAPQGAASAMRLTRWQLSGLVAQAKAGMGMRGSSIDHVAGARVPDSAPWISGFIAAWLQRGEGPLATYAKTFMGTAEQYRHPENIRFPMLVVVLFVADAARPAAAHARQSTSRFAFERLIAAPAYAGGICSTVSSFVSQTIADVENALSISGDGFFITLWNVAIKVISGVIQEAVAGVLAPIIAVLKDVAGALATITLIASTLQPWSVTVAGEPNEVELGDAPQNGKIVATLHAPSIDWPHEVGDCVQTLGGVDLSTISSKDAPVAWQPVEGFADPNSFASVTAKDHTMADGKTAALSYQSIVAEHAGQPNCASLQLVGALRVDVSVERIDVLHAQEQLAKVVLSQLPQVVRDHLMPVFGPLLAEGEKRLSALLQEPASGSVFVAVSKLVPNPLKCTPPPAPPGAPPVSNHSGDLIGTWKCVAIGHARFGDLDIPIVMKQSVQFGKDSATGFMGTKLEASGSSVHDLSVSNGGPAESAESKPYTYEQIDANHGMLHMAHKGNGDGLYPVDITADKTAMVLHIPVPAGFPANGKWDGLDKCKRI
ncbi:MAG: hypothetical protein M3N19_10455 [Candidatus Eremiobacteraeota bacterium]|nr:hypothetical protein [Candidatus Eremiobacteraeota bacterium]